LLLTGARQTGKSTLARWLATHHYSAQYLTLDDAAVLASARHDPAGFIAGMQGNVVLDEIQRVPELFIAIKATVDRHRTPGRFLLTGSTNVMVLPQLSEALAGRVEIQTLRPLSQGEIEGVQEGFIDAAFAAEAPEFITYREGRAQLLRRAVTGGYPEILQRSAAPRRSAWFGSYITTILQRDVRDLAHIEGLTIMPKLLSLLAARSGALLNFAELSRSIGLPQTTLKRYMSLLEMTFLIYLLPPWSGNLSRRLVCRKIGQKHANIIRLRLSTTQRALKHG
jgi:predicted AAA+ superfamily ATPase